VRVSAAAVQQPPRAWKLAAAVCQIWQSHQTQQVTPEQVSPCSNCFYCQTGAAHLLLAQYNVVLALM
jgi:hypothetical protein